MLLISHLKISQGTNKFVGPYPHDVYTNLVLIMKHKYYDEIKEQKQLKV